MNYLVVYGREETIITIVLSSIITNPILILIGSNYTVS